MENKELVNVCWRIENIAKAVRTVAGLDDIPSDVLSESLLTSLGEQIIHLKRAKKPISSPENNPKHHATN